MSGHIGLNPHLPCDRSKLSLFITIIIYSNYMPRKQNYEGLEIIVLTNS